MDQEIRLSGLVTISDIETWTFSAETVTFRVLKSVTFAPFAESAAIMRLHDFARLGTRIRVRSTFPITSSSLGNVGVFDTLFGLALVLEASDLLDSTSADIHSLLSEALWNRCVNAGGRFRSGQRSYVAFRDPDCPIPACLEAEGPTPFPLPTQFTAVLRSAVQSVTGQPYFVGSFAEDDVATCLYEAARNSFDHARVDVAGKAINGIRGVIIEKLIFHSFEQIDQRTDLNETLREYVKRVWNDMSDRTLLGFTVCDLGPGIHHTLPSTKGEDSWSKLARAFEIGESRKPPGSDATRGQGLDKLLRAAQRLHAYLLVRSSELLGFRDFSSQAATSDQPLSKWPWSKETGGCGTSVSIFWPTKKVLGDFDSFGQNT